MRMNHIFLKISQFLYPHNSPNNTVKCGYSGSFSESDLICLTECNIVRQMQWQSGLIMVLFWHVMTTQVPLVGGLGCIIAIKISWKHFGNVFSENRKLLFALINIQKISKCIISIPRYAGGKNRQTRSRAGSRLSSVGERIRRSAVKTFNSNDYFSTNQFFS